MPAELRRLEEGDADLAEIATELSSPGWEVSRPMTEESLREFLGDKGRVYLVANLEGALAGAAHGYLYPHPSGARYFFIDEVDTKEPYRRRGVARAMMGELIRLAGELGAEEAWLGTEEENVSAKALYESLGPDEVERGPIYMYKTRKK